MCWLLRNQDQLVDMDKKTPCIFVSLFFSKPIKEYNKAHLTWDSKKRNIELPRTLGRGLEQRHKYMALAKNPFSIWGI